MWPKMVGGYLKTYYWRSQESFRATETQSVPVTIVTHSHSCLCVHGVNLIGRGSNAALLPEHDNIIDVCILLIFPRCCTVLLCLLRQCPLFCHNVISYEFAFHRVRKWTCGMRVCEKGQLRESHGQCVRVHRSVHWITFSLG